MFRNLLQKLLFATLLVFAIYDSANACDFCMLGQGLNPYLTATGKGITIDTSFTESNAVYNRNSTIDSQGKKESWLVYSLTGFYPVTDDLTLLLTLPFAIKNNFDYDSTSNSNPGSSTQSIGDVSLTSRYTFSRIHSLESTWLTGALVGIKTPTGSVVARDNQGNFLDRHVQSGTGSFDYNLGLTSSFASSKGYQLTADFVYSFSGQGKWGDRDHRYGDSINASAKGFYKVTPIERVENSVYLFTGPMLESTGKEKGVQGDSSYNADLVNNSTGGIVILWDLGVYMPLTPQTIFNISFAKAFYHDMNQSDLFDADPSEDYKINMSISFLF